MKIRIAFSKHGKVRFTSHRDIARIWERALRRSALPVAYSEGFNPRPRLSFGLALSTGHESNGEYIDVDLAADADDIDLAGALALDMIEPARAVGLPKLAELCEALGRCCSGGDAIAARAVAERLLRVGEESLVAAAESVPARAGA